MFARLTWVIDETPHPAALNMAIDEALLLAGDDCPLFRAYRWREPSVSIGYFSSWAQARTAYPAGDMVRRWTGGGIVEHGDDFTYSLLLPVASEPPPNRDLYRKVHVAVADALAAKGRLPAVVTKGSDVPAAACFDRSVESDVEVDGVKVAGAAIRRLRIGVMLQGSIQRISIDDGFAARFTQSLSRSVEKRMLSRVTTLLAERIANEKYGAESWTRRY